VQQMHQIILENSWIGLTYVGLLELQFHDLYTAWIWCCSYAMT